MFFLLVFVAPLISLDKVNPSTTGQIHQKAAHVTPNKLNKETMKQLSCPNNTGITGLVTKQPPLLVLAWRASLQVHPTPRVRMCHRLFFRINAKELFFTPLPQNYTRNNTAVTNNTTLCSRQKIYRLLSCVVFLWAEASNNTCSGSNATSSTHTKKQNPAWSWRHETERVCLWQAVASS